MQHTLAIVALLAASARAEDVAELVAYLETDRAGEAAMKLADLGPAAKEAVPQLTRALASEDYGICWRVAWALSRIGPEAAAAAPEITRVARFQYGRPREAAKIALVRIGRGTTLAVLAALADAPDKWSKDAGADKSEFLDLLVKIDADPTSSIPAILALLENKSVQESAIDALRRMGPRASVALPGLGAFYAAQADKSPDLAEPLLEAMVAMGDPAIATLAEVADANLTDVMRGRAVGAMARIPGVGIAAARPLLEANSIRGEMEGALSQIALAGPHDSSNLVRSGPPALPGWAAVAKVLSKRVLPLHQQTLDNSYASETAAMVLACLLPVVPKSDRAQTISLLDQDYRARELAAWNVGRTGDFDCIAQLFEMCVGMENPTLDGFAVSGRTSWKALVARLDDGNAEIRQIAARGLLRIDAAKAEERVYLLGLGDSDACLFDDDLVSQYRALALLAEPVLTKGLTSDNPTTRTRSAIMLGALGDRDVVPQVLSALDVKMPDFDSVGIRVLDSIMSKTE